MDLCSKLTSAQTAQLSDSYTILEGTMNLVQAVYLNNNAAPFDNEKVRQAISYAINRQQILDMSPTAMVPRSAAASIPSSRSISCPSS